MKKAGSLLTLFLFSSVALSEDCARLAGSWYGSFALKDPRECRIYRGCSHSMLASVTHTIGIHYRAEVHPKIGRPGVYDLVCENGKVTSSDVSGTIMFNCLDNIVCQVKYDDDQLSANLLGTKT